MGHRTCRVEILPRLLAGLKKQAGRVFAISTIFLFPFASHAQNGELDISYIRTGCGAFARHMADVHKNRNRPLNPSLKPDFTYDYDALLGIIVQVRGQYNICKDLKFELIVTFLDQEKIYRGTWQSTISDCPSNVYGKTTDWWIPLSELYSSKEIKQICKNLASIKVNLLSYEFK